MLQVKLKGALLCRGCRMYQKPHWKHRAKTSPCRWRVGLFEESQKEKNQNIQKHYCWLVLMAPWLRVTLVSVKMNKSASVLRSLLLTCVAACVRRSGSAGARWRLWHVPMWGMFSARPPRTASLEEQAKWSTKTTGVWLKSGWTISKISSILSHQVQRCGTQHKVDFSLASSEIFILGKVDLSYLHMLRPKWRLGAPWYYMWWMLCKDSFCSHRGLIYEFLPLLCPALDF